MKLQFSLATLLVCMTVLAVVTAISVAIPANENLKFRLFALAIEWSRYQ